MLLSLHIENFALIRQSDIRFGDGFVAITGETGAGKSIMLGALGLLLGQRADTAVLAEKEKKCVVEAQFDIAGLALAPLFAELDVDYDDRLILRREILPSAKSRAFVNDTPVQLPVLKQIGSRIIDIHSQHQTLTLADSGYRLALLDTLAGGDSRAAYADAYRAYSALKKELEALTTQEAANRKEQDYLQYQFNELYEARLTADEQEELEAESQLLAHAEAVREGLATAAATLDDDSEQAVLPRLRQAKSVLSRVADYHKAAAELLSRLDSALVELDDINSGVVAAADGISYSPERQQEVDERLALLYRLEKKHGVERVADLIAIRDELDSRLQSIATLDDRIQALMERVDKAYAVVQQTAEALTQARRSAGEALTEGIIPTLHELGMPEVRFRVELTPSHTYGPQGCDSVAFLFNANKGGEMRDLSKVASGGELSRLMLAIKSMHTSRTLLPTIIFDEIDTGVSGDIAGAVGRIMRRMAQRMQVVAITHLPQIAALAGQHLKVYKETDAERTVSCIKELAGDARTTEVAVMLSADPPTPAALQTAKELMGGQ
ncbi:MAG: DNA repair protein RecN [Bacteroidales bacterium]|nr:DNA repair protein RecN [Bacteroidales bacterium]